MVPQALTEWASQKLGVEPPGVPAGHPAADQLLHFVYSVTWGALAAPVLFATARGRPAPKGDQRHRSPSLAPVGFNDQPIGWVIDPGVARRAITASSMSRLPQRALHLHLVPCTTSPLAVGFGDRRGGGRGRIRRWGTGLWGGAGRGPPRGAVA